MGGFAELWGLEQVELTSWVLETRADAFPTKSRASRWVRSGRESRSMQPLHVGRYCLPLVDHRRCKADQ